jgi:hypothetical protein
MTIASYSDLLTATADWLSRNDIDAARSADFVTLFEAYASRLLRDSNMEQTETLYADEGAATVDLPADFVEGRSLRHVSSPYERLTLESPASLGETGPTYPAGRPSRYAITGRQIVLWPAPNAAYDLTLVYHGGLIGLAASPAGRTTNWLLRAAPDAYLAGAIAEACDYLDDDRKSAKWSARRDAALQQIITNAMRARMGAGPIVTRPEVAGF